MDTNNGRASKMKRLASWRGCPLCCHSLLVGDSVTAQRRKTFTLREYEVSYCNDVRSTETVVESFIMD